MLYYRVLFLNLFTVYPTLLKFTLKNFSLKIFYDYPFSTPTKNAVNKRIIERCIFFPRLRRGKNIRQEP